MSAARARPRRMRREPELTLVAPAVDAGALVARAQRGWWVVGVLASLVAALGFQAYPPSRRLEVLERVTARQDSLFGAQQRTLDTIRRQLGQLIAGQCVKERDRMARVVIGC